MNKNQKALKNVKAQSKTSATQFDKTALKRLFSYMKEYKRQLVFVIIFILLSAVASAASSVFLQTLIDDYIVPLLGTDNPVFGGLIKALITIGIICNFQSSLQPCNGYGCTRNAEKNPR